jgi:iron complex transport system substrate-binding protein
VFKHDDMQGLIGGIEQKFKSVLDANPPFNGKKALLLRGRLDNGKPRALDPGWRSEFLTQMGFTIADRAEAADVLIWCTEGDDDQAALLADPAIAQRGRRNVFTGKDLAAAIAFGSPLSYPLVADQLPARIAQALA